MKKTAIATLGALCALTLGAAVFAACGDKDNENGGGTEKDFTITVENGEGYTAKADKTSADMGETVTITVTVTDPDTYIEKVLANGNELDENGDGKYTATVTTDLTIKVETGTYKEVLEDGDVSFNEAYGTTIAKNDSNELYEENTWSLRIDLGFGMMANLSSRSYITSSNQAVIPAEAISELEEHNEGSDQYLDYLTFTIDTSKIETGYTYLTIYVKSNETSSDGALCVKITVTDEPVAPETMEVTFKFENKTKYQDEDIFINITDIESGSYPETIWLSDFTNGKYTFEYVVGHTYRLTCSYAVMGEDGYYDTTPLYFNEWEGNNLGGAVNNIEKGTMNNADYVLTLTTEGIEVPLTITED